jgi:hypothetical protein
MTWHKESCSSERENGTIHSAAGYVKLTSHVQRNISAGYASTFTQRHNINERDEQR